MNKRFPYPKQYWIYMIMAFICSILLIGNIYRADGMGDLAGSTCIPKIMIRRGMMILTVAVMVMMTNKGHYPIETSLKGANLCLLMS